LAHLEEVLAATRTRINTANDIELAGCVRDLVSAFDTMAQQLVKELTDSIPLTPRRKAKFQGRFLRKAAAFFARSGK